MFGKNPVRKQELNDRLQVTEIWYTIQGEGPHSGLPAVFVRLTGCNLRCWFCDTQWDDDGDPYLTHEQVFLDIKKLLDRNPCNLVVLTGGEPLRQNLGPLIEKLAEHHVRVQIETAGTLWQDCLSNAFVDVVVSPKAGSVHKKTAAKACAYKYVIRAGEVDLIDGLPSYSTQQAGKPLTLARPPQGKVVYLSPCDEYDEVLNAANRAAVAKSCMEYGYRAMVQVHKHLDVA